MRGRIITLDHSLSTNTYLKDNSYLLEEQFLVVRSLHQTGGRGRQERSWHSSPGDDLTFSMVFIPGIPLEKTSAITLAAGLALYRVLSPEIPGLRLKWPNDLLCHDRKICGILCETLPGVQPAVIIGVGVNVNSATFPPELARIATSMVIETGKRHDLESLMVSIHDSLVSICSAFTMPLSGNFIDEWLDASVSRGRLVEAYGESGLIQGVIHGIDRDGALIVRTDEGSQIRCLGEVTYLDRNDVTGTSAKSRGFSKPGQ